MAESKISVKQQSNGTTNGLDAGDKMPQQKSWSRRFFQQLHALLYKNGLFAIRNMRASLTRLLASFFFMFLLWLFDKALQADSSSLAKYESVTDPTPKAIGGIPDCSTDFYALSPCWDLLYTPNTSAVVNDIVNAMRINNPGRVIPADKVLGFASVLEANVWMNGHPEQSIGALHFEVVSPTSIGFTLQANTTVKYFKGNFQNPDFFAALPMQVAAEREISAHYYQQEFAANTISQPFDVSSWNVIFKEFAHPALGTFSIVGQAIGPFIFAANMFGVVIAITWIVGEREARLKQFLKIMGMLDSAYWMSWMLTEFCYALVSTLLIIAFGAIFGFKLFLRNSFGLVFFLFFLFQLAMSSFAFVISVFISRTAVAVNLGFVLFIVGWIFQIVVNYGYPFTPDYYGDYPVLTVIFALLPFSLLTKGAVDLGDATSGSNQGLSFSEATSYCKDLSVVERAQQTVEPGTYVDYSCVMPLGRIFVILFVEWILYFFIAVYLDNVVPNENGVSKKPWYIFMPNYWAPKGRANFRHRQGTQTTIGTEILRPPLERQITGTLNTVDDDVAAEQVRLKDLLQHRSGSGDALAHEADVVNAVELYGLQKLFKGQRKCCGCPPCKSTNDFWAIKGSWFAIERNQLFCLLGPNGAGKTTTINCLTGVLPVSGGDALVYGEAITSPGGLDRIRSIMGVCPQFDVLWPELTGFEHLWIYGSIKGLPSNEVKADALGLLDKVNLASIPKLRSGQYSGGMKRRLSVAISLLGDPKIVYLDEPTTGMDPISRRQVWDIIEDAKKARAIVLTTHSMEEADILGDRIAIMARGRLRCLGSSIRLKQKFGSGYQVSVSLAPSKVGSTASLHGADSTLVPKRVAATKAFFRSRLGIKPVEEDGVYLQYLVPRAKEGELSRFLEALEEQRAELGVTDVQLSLTSLEEVFLNIARQAEVEAAAQDGGSLVSIYLEDGNEMKVPLGSDYGTHPQTGERFSIKWAQDDTGALQVLSWEAVDAHDGEVELTPVNARGHPQAPPV